MNTVFVWAKTVRDDDELSSTAKLVALVLNTYLKGSTGVGFPGVDTLASNVGKSRNTVRLALRELEKAGYLFTYARVGRSNMYERLVPL